MMILIEVMKESTSKGEDTHKKLITPKNVKSKKIISHSKIQGDQLTNQKVKEDG